MLLIELWRNYGYAAFADDALLAQVDTRNLTSPNDVAVLQRAARRACAGDFEDDPELLRLIADPCPSTTTIGLEMLGDWAPAKTLYASVGPIFASLSLASAPPDMSRVAAAARALARAGRLCDAPALFHAVIHTHGSAARNPERIDLSVHLGAILGDLDAPERRESLEDYRGHVGSRYHQLGQRYGTNLVYLYRGAPLDISVVIGTLLENIGNPPAFSLRDLSLVEANLGISRRDFVVEGRPQWLSIAATLEAARDDATELTPGERRFFGHRLEPADAAAVKLLAADTQLYRDALDVDEPFQIFEWAWSSKGYASLDPPFGGRLALTRRAWFSFALLVRDAKAGLQPELSPLAIAAAASGDPEFAQVTSEFLADACADDLLALWRARIDRYDDVQIAYLLCAALLRRGRLRDLPYVLDAYRKHSAEGDFPCLQLLFNEMLWIDPAAARFERHPELASWSAAWLPFASAEDCSRAVADAHNDLLQRHRTDDLLIYRGEAFSGKRVAEHVISLQEPWQLTLYLRGRFEAATGLDCQPFYARMVPQLDAAKLIAERFLTTADRTSRRAGTQVFFNHLVK